MNAKEYYSKIRKSRDAWRREMPNRCMSCLRSPDSPRNDSPLWLEVHEIERKSHAPKNWWPVSGCNGLLLCHWCHAKMGGKDWPHARQLALKLLRDANHFSLPEWLAIKPRPDTYVSMSEINKFAKGIA